MTPSEMIEWERKWLLMAAFSYNTEENAYFSDMVYDFAVSHTKKLKDRYPDEWKACDYYRDIFDDEEEAWTYTSQHFPINDEIKDNYLSYRDFVEQTKKEHEERKCRTA